MASLLATYAPVSPFSWWDPILAMWYSTLRLFAFASSVSLAVSAPPGFPTSGNGLWYTQPATDWTTEFLPVGNGHLAAMVPGGIWQETTQLNIESLWAGGPFSNSSYNGGNKLPYQRASLAQDMQVYREAIFQSPNGTIPDIFELQEDPGAYGSYSGAGYLLTTLASAGETYDYWRWLDLDDAIARATWSSGNATYTRETFCSNPTQACTQYLNSSEPLPAITYAWSVLTQTGLPLPNITCLDSFTLQVRGTVAAPGMVYELLFRAQTTGADARVTCSPLSGAANSNATLRVQGARESWVTWVGGTEYSMDAGDAAHSFSFRGADPHAALVALLFSATAGISHRSSLAAHAADYAAVVAPFSLDLGQTPDLGTPTDALRLAYATDVGNPYLEWLAFNYGRYMLASSARGTLPANLQGKWAQESSNPWSADYHANINVQMNYWMAEMTGMNVTQSLWDYMQKTWAPRGSLTAQILYNISEGWVTHNEMNIFGHTGMKNLVGDPLSAQWADYPESAVWMMIHVWDHFDYTHDIDWWKTQGWPLLKGVASFHVNKLVPDYYFNDSTLVVNPCNSPEQAPITFGCAHAQQLIWQLFNAVEKGFNASGDSDVAFLENVRNTRAQMDKGIHIGSWGQLQEWKVDLDKQNDTHRHLSHLIGLYPGYALSSYNASLQSSPPPASASYTKVQVLEAAKTSLIHRGNGTGPDGDAGWEKVWRAAAWAQSHDAAAFYHELTYALERNFGANLFSLYNPYIPTQPNTIFQIDANLGFPAAVLNALIQAPDTAAASQPLIITLLPALPAAWASGSVRGARLRGGLVADFGWGGSSLAEANFSMAPGVSEATGRAVEVLYNGKQLVEFESGDGMGRVQITL